MIDEKPLHVRVADALGFQCFEYGDHWEAEFGNECKPIPRYDTDWSAAGPLIERIREEGWMVGVSSDNGDEWIAWKDDIGQFRPHETYRGRGPTPLLAVCNLLLALKAAGKLP